MNREKKLKLNASSALINRFALIVSGLVIPRVILTFYGSEVNGLVSSLTQFLSLITFLDLGVGSVVQSALYRPLAQKDTKSVSEILWASKTYFNNIGKILIVYIIFLLIFFPFLTNSSTSYLSTALLIIALSISLLGQYYFGIVNELLLSADQKSYIQYRAETIVVILNILITILLANLGASIQILKLGSGLAFLFRPFYLQWYVNKNYVLSDNVDKNQNYLPQKWYGMGQHIAITIQNSTDIVVLTIFSTLENVSVYAIYNYIVLAIRMIITSLTTSMKSFFGDMLAKDEVNELNSYFDRIEWLLHVVTVYLFSLMAVLITPFVMIYTSGVNDANYNLPIFSFLLVLANLVYAIRIPYQTLIYSAGHFKETQLSSYIEACINIFISSIMVHQWGLVGVTIGTLFAMVYRTLYLVFYLSKNIVKRPRKNFFKLLGNDFVIFLLIFGTGKKFLEIFSITSYIEWFVVATALGLISLIFIFGSNFILQKKQLMKFIKKLLNRK